jgi:hypothetical protein
LKEVVYPVLEFREEKRTFVKVEGGKLTFSFYAGSYMGF